MLAVQHQRGLHVIHHGRVIDQAHLAAEAGVLHQLELLTSSDGLADQFTIAVQNSFAVGVDDGGVIDRGPTAYH